MSRQSKDFQITAMAGEFLTAGKLFKRGYQVSVTFGNAKAIDILILNPANEENVQRSGEDTATQE